MTTGYGELFFEDGRFSNLFLKQSCQTATIGRESIYNQSDEGDMGFIGGECSKIN